MKLLSGKTLLFVLLGLTVIITLMPFFRVGFTTGDDLEYYLTWLVGDLFTNANIYAHGAGRFFFLITKPIYSFPYIGDNFFLTKLIQYASLLLAFVLFAITVSKIFKSTELGLLSFLILFVPLSVTPDYYIPVISYPLFFTFSFSLALLSLLSLLSYFETGKNKFLIVSALLFAVTVLFYETYLLFLLFTGIFIFVRSCRQRGTLNTFKSKPFYKEIMPFVAIGIIYLIVYFSFRAAIRTPEGFYSGSSFSKDFNWANFIKILFKYNNGALPTKIYHLNQDIISANSLLAEGHKNNFWYILTHSSLLWIVNAIIQAILFFFILLKNKTAISWKKIGLGILFSFLFAIFAHFLVAIAEKYNSEYAYLNGYVTTFYSYFGITLLFSLVLFGFYKIASNKKWLQYPILAIMTCLVFYISIVTSYSNDHLSRDWQHSHNRFNLINEMSKEKVFDGIPENALIYSPDLYETCSFSGKNVCNQNFKWEVYIDLKSGRKYNVCRYPEELLKKMAEKPEAAIYRLIKRENIKNNDVLAVVAKIDKKSLNLQDTENIFTNTICDEADIYFYSPKNKFTINYNIAGSDTLQPQKYAWSTYIQSNHKVGHLINATIKKRNMVVESFKMAAESPAYQADTLIIE